MQILHMLMAMEKIIDIDIYKRYKLFVWVILNDMYNLDIKAVCAKNARAGMMIKNVTAASSSSFIF